LEKNGNAAALVAGQSTSTVLNGEQYAMIILIPLRQIFFVNQLILILDSINYQISVLYHLLKK